MSRRRTAALAARARVGRGPRRAGPRRPGQARHVLQRRRQGHRLRERRHRLRGGDRREGPHRGGRVTQTAKPDFAVARFLPNGAPDTEFSKDGRVTADLGGTDYGFDLALQSDGKIVVAGERDTKTQNTFALVRCCPRAASTRTSGAATGSSSPTSGSATRARTPSSSTRTGTSRPAGSPRTARPAAGRSRGTGRDGVLDKSWGKDGRVTVDLSPSDESIRDLLFVPGGKLVGVGYAESGADPAVRGGAVPAQGHARSRASGTRGST